MKQIKQLFTVAIVLCLVAVMLAGCIHPSDILHPSRGESDTSSHPTETFPHQSDSGESEDITPGSDTVTTPQQSEEPTTESDTVPSEIDTTESDTVPPEIDTTESDTVPPEIDTSDDEPISSEIDTTESEPDTDDTGENDSSSDSNSEDTGSEESSDASGEDTPTERPIRIYIDQGHCPHSNAGAEGNGYKEQDITYTVGVLLAELLSQDPRFEVQLSRPTPETVLGVDRQSSLQARCNGANEWQADYFISIHTNAFNGTASGCEAYSFPNDTESIRIGEGILSAINAQTQLRNRGMKDGSHLYVIKNTKMPALLVEMGFIDNQTDALLMGEQPELFASALYQGIQAYFTPAAEGDTIA